MHVSVLLLPLAAGYHLSLPLSVARTVRRAAAPSLCDDEMSWQEELERVLSPGTAQSDREVLLKDLLGRGPEIAQQVTEAVSSGSFASLLPENGQSSELMDDLATFTIRRYNTTVVFDASGAAENQQGASRADREDVYAGGLVRVVYACTSADEYIEKETRRLPGSPGTLSAETKTAGGENEPWPSELLAATTTL